MKPYPLDVHERLYYFNKTTVEWIAMAAAGREHPLLENDSLECARLDCRKLGSMFTTINLWVGARTMLLCWPPLERLQADLDEWCAELPGREEVRRSYASLCAAVKRAETSQDVSQYP